MFEHLGEVCMNTIMKSSSAALPVPPEVNWFGILWKLMHIDISSKWTLSFPLIQSSQSTGCAQGAKAVGAQDTKQGTPNFPGGTFSH